MKVWAGSSQAKPPLPEPDRAQHEEAVLAIRKEIEELQVKHDALRQRLAHTAHCKEGLASKKAELRNQLDVASRALSQLQDEKDMLVHESTSRQQESQEALTVAQIDERIATLEETMWSQKFSLADEKRMLAEIATLHSCREQQLSASPAPEAVWALSQESMQALAKRIDAINESIGVHRERKKAAAAAYQEMMESRQQDVCSFEECHQSLEAVGRQRWQKEQELARLEREFVRKQRECRSLSRASQSKHQAAALQEGRSTRESDRHQAPQAWRRRFSQHQQGPPQDPELQRHLAEVERELRKLEDEDALLDQQGGPDDHEELVNLNYIIGFCEELQVKLGRNKGAVQASQAASSSSRELDVFPDCRLLRDEDREAREFLGYKAYHARTSEKRAYRRSRQRTHVPSMSKVLDQQHCFQQSLLTQHRTGQKSAVSFGARCQRVGDMHAVVHDVRGWHVFQDMGIHYPATVDDVPAVIEEARRLRQQCQDRMDAFREECKQARAHLVARRGALQGEKERLQREACRRSQEQDDTVVM